MVVNLFLKSMESIDQAQLSIDTRSPTANSVDHLRPRSCRFKRFPEQGPPARPVLARVSGRHGHDGHEQSRACRDQSSQHRRRVLVDQGLAPSGKRRVSLRSGVWHRAPTANGHSVGPPTSRSTRFAPLGLTRPNSAGADRVQGPRRTGRQQRTLSDSDYAGRDACKAEPAGPARSTNYCRGPGRRSRIAERPQRSDGRVSVRATPVDKPCLHCPRGLRVAVSVYRYSEDLAGALGVGVNLDVGLGDEGSGPASDGLGAARGSG